MRLNFSASGKEPIKSRELLPPDTYQVMITDTREKETSKGGTMLIVDYEVLLGPHQGSPLQSWHNVVNDSEKAMEMAERELATICRAVGREAIGDTEELHGQRLVVRVGIKQDEGYEPKNVIRMWSPWPKVQAVTEQAKLNGGKIAGAKPLSPAIREEMKSDDIPF